MKKANHAIVKLKDILSMRLSFCIIILCTISSCNLLTTNGYVGYSASIQDSKNRGVFISEYRPLINPYRINDSLSINVKSAWMEHSWKYAGLFSEKTDVDSDSFHLIIKTDSKSLKNYLTKWLISVDSTYYFGGMPLGETLVGDFKIIPEDSIVVRKVENRLVSPPGLTKKVDFYFGQPLFF